MVEIGLGLFFIFLLVLIILDVAMIVSLVKPGDERRQMIVWKASTYTLLVTAGSMVINVIESIVRVQAMVINPFIQLGVTALIYFVLILFFKKKYGG